jgi:P-type E1-E2 ATPase
MGRAARRGLFIKGADGVERLARVNHVILDKTGTLTKGNLGLSKTLFAEGVPEEEQYTILQGVAALEKQSGHVIASAFREIETKDVVVSDVRVIAGVGIEGVANGARYSIGSESFLAERVPSIPELLVAQAEKLRAAGFTVIFVAREHELVAALALGDRVRSGARETIQQLREFGFTIELLSGDHPQAVAFIAAELGISQHTGGVSPEDKLKRVETLEAQEVNVAMVGDGINDAAALRRASVGISVTEAADVARDAADLFIASRGPLAIAEAFRVSRRALRVIHVNIAIAILYNAIGAVLAITGHISPLLAAILMPLSSLTVLTIASRA